MTKINRRPFHGLYENKSTNPVLQERQPFENTAVETVKRIVTGPIVCLAIIQ